MPTFVTFYAYAFEGAPYGATRGWFSAPGIAHLLTARARTALGRATGEHVEVYRCKGTLDDDRVTCDEAEVLFEGEARDALWWFSIYNARSVLPYWEAPELVREYLKSGSTSLRAVAHKCAWAATLGLEGLAKVAARVTMYATQEQRSIFAAREACRLSGKLAGDRLPAIAAQQERALASVLLAVATGNRAEGDTLVGGGGSSRSRQAA